jgi:hypothetical protein
VLLLAVFQQCRPASWLAQPTQNGVSQHHQPVWKDLDLVMCMLLMCVDAFTAKACTGILCKAQVSQEPTVLPHAWCTQISNVAT